MAYALGSTVPLTIDIVDADGAATDASTVVLTVELPDGTTVEPTVTNPTTGRYQADYVPTTEGRYAVSWASTSPGSASADVFDVRALRPRYLISLADAKAHLNMSPSSTVDDAELLGHIEAATSAIEDYLGETIVRTVVVEKRTLTRQAQVLLRSHPVVSLTSVVSLDGATTWDVADLDLDVTTGLVRTITGPQVAGDVVITYVAGRSVIPANYARAAEIVVANLWEAQRKVAAGPAPGPLAPEDEIVTDQYGTAIPPVARQLLGAPAVFVG